MTPIFILLLLIQTSLCAEWKPTSVLDLSSQQCKIVRDSSCISLRSKIFKFIKGSWCSKEKAQLIFELIVLTRPKVCVEIGAYQGASTFPILAALRFNKRGRAYVVDAWSNTAVIQGLPQTDPNTIWWKNTNLDDAKKNFYKMISSRSFSPFAVVLEMTSEHAVKQIPNIDFLHLDGNCSEIGALQDSQRYMPKVVSGGYIVLSNATAAIAGSFTKIKALWPILEQCDIICEIDQGDTLLFKKR